MARHGDILRAVPPGCAAALDVGCGDGLLARKLAGQAQRVTAIDKSADMIARARDLATGYPGITFIEGDFLTVDLPPASYDFVCSVTVIHHMDFAAALLRMRELLRPGGRLLVVGLAREATLARRSGQRAVKSLCRPPVRGEPHPAAAHQAWPGLARPAV